MNKKKIRNKLIINKYFMSNFESIPIEFEMLFMYGALS